MRIRGSPSYSRSVSHRRRRRRGIVAEAQLPVRVGLTPDRFDAGAQPARIGVVDRGDDADERLVAGGRRRRARASRAPPRRACAARPSADRPRRPARRCRPCAAARATLRRPSCAGGARRSRSSGGPRRRGAPLEARFAEERPGVADARRRRATRVESVTTDVERGVGRSAGAESIDTVCQRRSVQCAPGSIETVTSWRHAACRRSWRGQPAPRT